MKNLKDLSRETLIQMVKELDDSLCIADRSVECFMKSLDERDNEIKELKNKELVAKLEEQKDWGQSLMADETTVEEVSDEVNTWQKVYVQIKHLMKDGKKVRAIKAFRTFIKDYRLDQEVPNLFISKLYVEYVNGDITIGGAHSLASKQNQKLPRWFF